MAVDALALPPTAQIATPVAGATYALGQVVGSSFSCSDGTGGPGIASCLDQNSRSSGPPIDTSTTGPHTFTVTATSKDGQTGTASITYAVAGAPSVSIGSPISGARYARRLVVRASYSCRDPRHPPNHNYL